MASVKIKWTDPPDIITNEPVPCTWAGTVVVRKEGSAPRHRWDGTLIVDSTTRDEYSVTPLVDDTVETDKTKTYFYGIFPYHVWLDDANNPIKHYRYTKVFKVETKTVDNSIPLVTLLDTSNSFVSSYAQDFTVLTANNVGNWEIANNMLSGQAYRAGGETAVYVINQLFNKGNKTKLYVDLEATGHDSSGNALGIVFYKKMPEYWNDLSAEYIYKVEWYTTAARNEDYPRTASEISLNDIDGNFYIGVYLANYQHGYVRKIGV